MSPVRAGFCVTMGVLFNICMLPITRETKRLIIVVIIALSLLVFGTLMYYWLRPTQTCTDGIENQDEEGIDCGGVCRIACVVPVVGNPLTVPEVAFVADGTGKYDVIARVTNPNQLIGADPFSYAFILVDANGNELTRETGSAWILPHETKTILAIGLPSMVTPAKVLFEIQDVAWQELTEYREAPKLTVYEKKFALTSSSVSYAEVSGVLVNESAFDLRKVVIRAILRDASGKPVAVNQTQMSTLSVNAREEFHIIWPKAFSGTVTQVEVEADSNVYNQENFLKRYQPNGRFQDFRATPAQF